MESVVSSIDSWLPIVRRLRPEKPWDDVIRVLNSVGEVRWTAERLRRTVRRLVAEGIAEPILLDRAPRRKANERLIVLVAGIAAAAPNLTLQQIASQLQSMRERTPSGGTRWHHSSVRNLLRQAARLGLGRTIVSEQPQTRTDPREGDE